MSQKMINIDIPKSKSPIHVPKFENPCFKIQKMEYFTYLLSNSTQNLELKAKMKPWNVIEMKKTAIY
jgi:hypothetical protein